MAIHFVIGLYKYACIGVGVWSLRGDYAAPEMLLEYNTCTL